MRGYFDSIEGRDSVLKPTRLACAHWMVCSVCNKDSRLLFAVFALSLHKKILSSTTPVRCFATNTHRLEQSILGTYIKEVL